MTMVASLLFASAWLACSRWGEYLLDRHWHRRMARRRADAEVIADFDTEIRFRNAVGDWSGLATAQRDQLAALIRDYARALDREDYRKAAQLADDGLAYIHGRCRPATHQ